MTLSAPRVDPAIIAVVLAGVSYPARTWQLLAQADHYGAGGHIRAALSRLPADLTYPSIAAVIATLNHVAPGPPPGNQPG